MKKRHIIINLILSLLIASVAIAAFFMIFSEPTDEVNDTTFVLVKLSGLALGYGAAYLGANKTRIVNWFAKIINDFTRINQSIQIKNTHH